MALVQDGGVVLVSGQTPAEAQTHPVGDSSLSGLEREITKDMRKPWGRVEIKFEPTKIYLVDSEGQFGSGRVIDVEGAALR